MRTQLQIIRELNAIRERAYDNRATVHDQIMEGMLIKELNRNYKCYSIIDKDSALQLLARAMQRMVIWEMQAITVPNKPDWVMLYDELMEDLELFLFGGVVLC